MLTVLNNPAVIALIAAVPSILLALFGYRQSVRLDKRAEVSGAAAFQLGAIGHVIDGLNSHVASLQKDNEILREGATKLAGERVASAMERIANSAEDVAEVVKDQAEDASKK